MQRKDDTVEAIKARLAKYRAEEAAIVPYYEGHGLLRRIDGNASPQVVRQRIVAALGAR